MSTLLHKIQEDIPLINKKKTKTKLLINISLIYLMITYIVPMHLNKHSYNSLYNNFPSWNATPEPEQQRQIATILSFYCRNSCCGYVMTKVHNNKIKSILYKIYLWAQHILILEIYCWYTIHIVCQLLSSRRAAQQQTTFVVIELLCYWGLVIHLALLPDL